MLSLIDDSCVSKKQWITHDEMMNITVIAESTPGPIAINCATYVGYKQKGLIGAVAATAGIVLPSFCIIFLISMFLDRFLEIQKMKRKPVEITMMILACILMLIINVFSFRISSFILVLAAAVISLAYFFIRQYLEKAGSER